jgi:hypothetical protein
VTNQSGRIASVRQRVAPVYHWARRHPDAVAIIAVTIVAVVIRLALAYRAPIFIRRDSIVYFQSAYELVRGIGLDLPLRRTPGYPLFMAGAIWWMGEDFQGIALAQHGLGVLSAILTYVIGRALFGRWAGALSGIMVALSGPLLIYEHYLMSETLFTFLLTAAVCILVLGLHTQTGRASLIAGALLGLAFLARPIGLAVLPAIWLGLLVVAIPRRKKLVAIGLMGVGFVALAGPSFAWNRLRGGEPAPVMGQTLYDRVARHDEGFVLPAPSSFAPTDDSRQANARRVVLQMAARDAAPSAVSHRLRTNFGLTEAEADRAMMDVALDVIGQQLPRYLQGTLAKSRSVLMGDVERYSFHWNTRVEGELREAWQSRPSIAHALTPPSESQRRERPIAEWIVNIFQPARYRNLLGGLIVVSLIAGAIRSAYRPTLLLGAVVLALVIPAAAAVGYLPRYRYPGDPLLAVLAAGGVCVLVTGGIALARRVSGAYRLSPASISSPGAPQEAA